MTIFVMISTALGRLGARCGGTHMFGRLRSYHYTTPALIAS
jgi:hypothetical protein